MRQLLLFPGCPPAPATPRPFDEADRAALLEWLSRGASPQSACARLGLDVAGFFATVDGDESFRERLRQARVLMTHNVVSVVYAAAVKGTPAAQALWLRTFPPTESLDFDPPSTNGTDDEFALLSDEALEREVLACRTAADRAEPSRP